MSLFISIIILILCLWDVKKRYDVMIEYQLSDPEGFYLIWRTGELNAFGEYYKLIHRKCIWKIHKKE